MARNAIRVHQSRCQWGGNMTIRGEWSSCNMMMIVWTVMSVMTICSYVKIVLVVRSTGLLHLLLHYSRLLVVPASSASRLWVALTTCSWCSTSSSSWVATAAELELLGGVQSLKCCCFWWKGSKSWIWMVLVLVLVMMMPPQWTRDCEQASCCWRWRCCRPFRNRTSLLSSLRYCSYGWVMLQDDAGNELLWLGLSSVAQECFNLGSSQPKWSCLESIWSFRSCSRDTSMVKVKHVVVLCFVLGWAHLLFARQQQYTEHFPNFGREESIFGTTQGPSSNVPEATCEFVDVYWHPMWESYKRFREIALPSDDRPAKFLSTSSIIILWQAVPWGAEEELLLGGRCRRNHGAMVVAAERDRNVFVYYFIVVHQSAELGLEEDLARQTNNLLPILSSCNTSLFSEVLSYTHL